MSTVNISDFKDYAEDMLRAWNYFKQVGSDGVEGVMELRGYQDDAIRSVLDRVGFVFLPSEVDMKPLKKLVSYPLMGLETSSGACLLGGRYVFPVRDMLGNILAFIGWYPDLKKYITTPSKYFSKSYLYFGLEQVSKDKAHDDYIFVTEGIFDSLSLRALGFKAYASMGVNSTKGKLALHHLISEGKPLIGVPDTDKTGRKVLQRKDWGVDKYLTWYGDFVLSDFTGDLDDEEASTPVKVKDVDDLVKLFDASALKPAILAELKNSMSVAKIYLKG